MVQRKVTVGHFQHHFVELLVQQVQQVLMEKMVQLQMQWQVQQVLQEHLDQRGTLEHQVQKVTQVQLELPVQPDLLDQEVEVLDLKVTQVQQVLLDRKVILELRVQCKQ
jgi:hypothetical protein